MPSQRERQFHLPEPDQRDAILLGGPLDGYRVDPGPMDDVMRFPGDEAHDGQYKLVHAMATRFVYVWHETSGKGPGPNTEASSEDQGEAVGSAENGAPSRDAASPATEGEWFTADDGLRWYVGPNKRFRAATDDELDWPAGRPSDKEPQYFLIGIVSGFALGILTAVAFGWWPL